jgi:hypothetical protein
MSRIKLVDPKCYELAEYFLADNKTATEEQKVDLAQHIQDAIEMWPGQLEPKADSP